MDVNGVESVRGLNALMFAAAANRAEVIKLLAAKGADVKAATKVIDLSALTRGGGMGFNGGNPPVPGQPPREGQQAGGPALRPRLARLPAQGRPAHPLRLRRSTAPRWRPLAVRRRCLVWIGSSS